MGNNLNKDKDVQIYLALDKNMSYAGQNVTGAVHIVCTKDRPYTNLDLRIMGNQRIQFSRHYGQNNHQIYVNDKDTYFEEFKLVKFDHGIKTGHYSFPFSFLLPSAFPGSFKGGYHNHINYELSAVLLHYDEKSQDQIFKRQLHIREPYRGPPRNLSGKSQSQSKCWNCCCDCGVSKLSLEANIYHLKYNKIFRVTGFIDAGMSKADIKNVKIVLREKIKQVAVGGVTNVEREDVLLYETGRGVASGQEERVEKDVKVPEQVIGYTAIGNIISRCYFLVLAAQMNCCYSNPQLEVPAVLVSSLEPDLSDDENKAPPQGWNPTVAQPLAFVNLKPYIYNPEASISIRNQAGQPKMMKQEMKMDPMVANHEVTLESMH